MQRYELLRSLGKGAGGQVHLARDRLLGDRLVALKQISTPDPDDIRPMVLEHEFSVMSSISVQGVARVHDFGIWDRSSAYYTRAYVDGTPLGDVLEGRSTWDRLQLFARVARVVELLHRAGVVHGDIKPGNVIIDADDNAHLIDFGLARFVGTQQLGACAGGTPFFMAPELLRGAEPSVCSDVYSLGATLWYVIKGEPAPSPLPEDVGETALQKPEARALELARRALTPYPLDRLPTVQELLAALVDAFPKLAEEDGAPHQFVMPRPRGHNQLLARLRELFAVPKPDSMVLLTGGPGSGKSSLLRNLKWFLQLRGDHVVEVLGERTSESAYHLKSLAMQLAMLNGSAEAANTPQTVASPSATAMEHLTAARSARDAYVLIDNIDMLDPIVKEVLARALAANAEHALHIICTATSTDPASLGSLSPDEKFEIPRLASTAIREIAIDVLGTVDVSVLEALEEYTQGLPAALVDALASLSKLGAPTAADVHNLRSVSVHSEYAQARLQCVPKQASPILETLTVLGNAPNVGTLARLVPELDATEVERLVAQCEQVGVLIRRADGIAPHDRALHEQLANNLGPKREREVATRILHEDTFNELSLVSRARIAVAACDTREVLSSVPEACRELERTNSFLAASSLYETLLHFAKADELLSAQSSLAHCYWMIGELQKAANLAEEVLAHSPEDSDWRAQATLTYAQALTDMGTLDQAIKALSSVPETAPQRLRARAYRDLAEVHLRRADYTALRESALVGLRLATEDQVRSALLRYLGMADLYRGKSARSLLNESLALARQAEAPREEAKTLATLGMSFFREGEFAEARSFFDQALEIARRLGDIGTMSNLMLNLGTTHFSLGDLQTSAAQYRAATNLARRAGRRSPYLQSRCNAVHLEIYLGGYEQARSSLQQLANEFSAGQQRYIEAQIRALSGELSIRSGNFDDGIQALEGAIEAYEALGQEREQVDHRLDCAEALLDRGLDEDLDHIDAHLRAARNLTEQGGLDDLKLRLETLEAAWQVASLNSSTALQTLESVAERASEQGNQDLQWRALALLSHAHLRLGSRKDSVDTAARAVAVLESISLRAPREHREAFWRDPRRRTMKERTTKHLTGRNMTNSSHANGNPGLTTIIDDNRVGLLLDLTRQLAIEQDPSQLLRRILDGATALVQAEHGLLLLLTDQGDLEVTARTRVEDTATSTLSRCIAEAVLIDHEPIVTSNAIADPRLSEYRSVHVLQLRSVACVPITGRTGTLGVLYLEDRSHSGRFTESAVSLLSAFAGQAAIALENAKLLQENLRRQQELTEANQALLRATADLEEALHRRSDDLADARRELDLARSSGLTRPNRHGMIGCNRAMLRVFDTLDRLREAKVPVVVCGETGTGKELVARAIHQSSERAKGPFVAVNCGSLPEELLESELFGHAKGAFTGADRNKQGLITRATGGTLFLDEVGDMPPRMQVDLLRVLQESEVTPLGSDTRQAVDVRYVVASHKRLSELVTAGRFREDLYYRLNVVEISLPPLRERRDDILPLCLHFLDLFRKRDGITGKRLSKEAVEYLCEHPLPGNVRQLENMLHRASVLTDGPTITLADVSEGAELGGDSCQEDPPLATLPEPIRTLEPEAPPSPDRSAHTYEEFKMAERDRIVAALEAHNWNRSKAARELGMPRRTFYRRLEEYELVRSRG